MRKIEEEMVAAIHNQESWAKDNTIVTVSDDKTSAWVYLHGNHIGSHWYRDNTFHVNLATLRRFPTNTTLARLRALGVDVRRKNGIPLLNGEAV